MVATEGTGLAVIGNEHPLAQPVQVLQVVIQHQAWLPQGPTDKSGAGTHTKRGFQA